MWDHGEEFQLGAVGFFGGMACLRFGFEQTEIMDAHGSFVNHTLHVPDIIITKGDRFLEMEWQHTIPFAACDQWKEHTTNHT